MNPRLSIPAKLLTCCIPFIILFGCATAEKQAGEDGKVGTGIYNYTEIKNPGTPVSTEIAEIRLWPTPTETPTEAPYLTPVPGETMQEVFTGVDSDGPAEPLDLSVFVSYVRYVLLTTMQTTFTTTHMDASDWNSDVEITGNGVELGLAIRPEIIDNLLTFGVKLGYVAGVTDKNNLSNSGYSVSESLHTEALFLSWFARVQPVSFFYGVLGTGYTTYSIKTSVSTELPEYVYEGLTGTHGYGSLNIGLGLISPEVLFGRGLLELSGSLPFEGSVFENMCARLSAGIQVKL